MPRPGPNRVALILVINVAMLALPPVRDEGHIGMESLIGLLPQAQFVVGNLNSVITVFRRHPVLGLHRRSPSLSGQNMIPTLGISEAYRYMPCVVAGGLIVLFFIEH